VLRVLTEVILPIVLIAGAGFLLERTTRLDVRTLSKLNVNLLVPVFLFDNFYHMGIRLGEAWTAAFFTWGVMVAMLIVALIVGRGIGFQRSMLVAFAVSTIFYNCGNYGLSVMELVFSGEEQRAAMAMQTVVLTTQNLTNFTLGVFFISSGTRSLRQSALNAVRYPIIPAFLLAIALRALRVELPTFLSLPITRLASAVVPMGLVTLGVQIGTVARIERLPVLGLSAAIRLLLGPLAALGLIHAFGLSGLTAQVLLIGASVPTAVNTALLSIEFKTESNFASQAVVFSTLASIVTMSIVVFYATTFLS
jgi:hypothetical protein